MVPDYPHSSPSSAEATPPPPQPPPSRARLASVLVVAALLGVSACSASNASGPGGQPAAHQALSGDRLNLRDVCPETMVVQTPWFPQVELAVVYQLLGKDYRMDINRKTVTGPLIAHGGTNTGVKIEIRTGGPAIGYQQVSAQMYQDKSITLGMVPTDETVENSIKQPTLAVMAPFDIDPLALAWDPKAHPEFHTIADIGQTDTTVLYFQGESTFIDYLVGTGILRRSQVDGSYDGTPSRLVASRGKVVFGAFATSEPWKFEHEVPAWGKPLEYALVSDAGYPMYRNEFVIRAGDKQKLAPCLRKLVPILQQSIVDFMTRPAPTTATTLSILGRYKTFYTDSPARSAHAVTVMREQALVGNGTNSTIGDFDTARVQKIISNDVPIYASQHRPVKNGLKPEDIATNEFIDSAIGLPNR
jgi:hypothetical protein